MFWKRQHSGDAEYDQEVLKLAKVLIAKGADNNKNSVWHYPLYNAATYGVFEWVKLLKEAGADASLKGEDGKNAIEAASGAGFTEIANYLQGKDNKEYEQTLMYFVKKNQLLKIPD